MKLFIIVTIVCTLLILIVLLNWLKQDVHQLVKVSIQTKFEQVQQNLIFTEKAAQILQEKQQFYEQQLQLVEQEIYKREDILQTMKLIIQDKKQELIQLENTEITPQMAVQVYNERKNNL